MAIQGLRGSGNFAADERPKNWREAVLHLFPNGNVPLTALTNQMKKHVIFKNKFKSFGCETVEINGHNIKEIYEAFD